jgi:hypothetical protein
MSQCQPQAKVKVNQLSETLSSSTIIITTQVFTLKHDMNVLSVLLLSHPSSKLHLSAGKD